MSAVIFQEPEMQEIFEGFLIETFELLDSISQDLVTIENNPEDMDLLNQLFRSFHTIKGTSSFMGFESITNITHHAEDILNKLRRSELQFNLSIIDVLLEVHDIINLLVNNIKAGNDITIDYTETIKKIERLKNPEFHIIEDTNDNEIDKIEVISKPDPIIDPISAVLNNPELISKPGDFTPEELKLIESAFNQINQNFHFSQELLSNIKADESENNNDDGLSEKKTIDNNIEEETDNGKTDIEKGFNKEANEPSGKQNKDITTKATTDTIRVDVDRVESLMDLSGELVLGRNRLSLFANSLAKESINKEKLHELMETTAQIDFITSEIQSAVMKMRMVPIAKLYQKVPRIVRDLSREFGKKINLVFKGEETEIDRGIIEELNDPLVHMIRNSCDHGIEPIEEREAKGKPPIGTITLDAEPEGNAIVLRISDDGRGMDPEKLKNKALEKGIITEEQASLMTKREIFQLIFAPGFSTAVKVSSVSGRGVGMDVVRTNILKLKGIIEIESEIDKGTTFIIKLPLTLAIIQGLLVRILNETFAIPLSSVVEVVSIDINQIHTMKNQEMIRIRDDVNPLIRLDKVLKINNNNDSLVGRYVVIIGIGIHRFGLVVDELLGQQEIVIKTLGEFLGYIPGIAGSTIMGDGKVIMIIDVVELVKKTFDKDFN